jgi:hypothetical protein
MNARTVMALILCLGWGCDYTPNAPTPSSTPPPNGPVQVTAIPPGSLATFAILDAFPPEASLRQNVQLRLPLDRNEEFPFPILEFQFTYPRDMTLGGVIPTSSWV